MTTLIFSHLLGWWVSELSKEREKRRAYVRAWHQRNPGKRKALNKKRYAEKRDEILAQKKEYHKANREAIAEKGRKHYQANRVACRAKNKTYADAHRQELNDYARQYRQDNPKKIQAAQKKWWAENSKEENKKNVVHRRLRYANDPAYRLVKCLRARLRHAVKGIGKTARTLELIGCPVEQLRGHLEKQFRPGMTWKNYGAIWEVDHVRPCASFDLTRPEQQKQCFHFNNLQPLFAEENRSKGDKWPTS